MIKKWLSPILFLCTLSSPYINAASIENSQETFIQSNGSQLFCRVLGKGDPILVIHGGPGLSQDYLLPYLNKLAENHFVIFYDQRGCGRSTGEINENTMHVSSFVSDIENIRRAFHFDKISILGHSWGGFLGMHYAIAHPEALKKLILSNTMPACSEDLGLFIQEYLKRTSPYQKELAKITSSREFQTGDTNTIERFYRILFRTYCYKIEKADLLNLQFTPEASVKGAKVSSLLRQNAFKGSFNLSDSLKNLRIPTLIIHGDSDPVPHSAAQNIHESIPESKYVLLKQCGHFPYVEQPDAYFTHIKEFLNAPLSAKKNP